jgi:hypothetical protein
VTPDKQYLIHTSYGDGSGNRKVMTWAEAIERFKNPPFPGSVIQIEEL